MTIRFATKQDFDEVLLNKEYTYFNWEYIEDASKALNSKNISLFLEHEGNKCIIPLIRKTVFGFYPVAFSIPFGLYGGIIAQNDIDTNTYALLMSKIRKHLKLDIIFQNIFDDALLNKTNFTKINKVFSHITITKNKTYNEYLQKEFSHGMKEGVKKATKNNVKIVVGNNMKLIDDFYMLYESSNISWGKKKPRYSLNFFKHFLNKEYLEIRIAYHLEQPAGGLAMLKFKNYYFDWFAGMNKELRNSRANDYLHADLIKESIEKNYTMINFGASANLMGVQKFKESFGAKETEYHTYFFGNPIAKVILHLIIKFFY